MVYNKKQRIVGTIVLMALVGLLFPVIFDGGDTFQAELESRIPPEPQFSLLPEPNPTRPVIIADADLSHTSLFVSSLSLSTNS